MGFLTPKDWNSIGGSLLAVVVFLGGFALWRVWRNHKAGKPLVDKGQLATQLQNVVFIALVVLMMPAVDIAQRHGWGSWAWVWMAVPFVLIALVMGGIQRRVARKHAIANPMAAPVAKPPASAEERRVNLKLLAVVLGVAVLIIGPITLAVMHVDKLGGASAVVVFFFAALGLAVLAWGVAGRWPWTVSTAATVEINAAPEKVWETVRFDSKRVPWKKIVRRVEALDESGQRYRLHYFNNEACAACGLPRDPDSEGVSITVDILDEVYLQRLAWRASPPGRGGAVSSMMDHEVEVLSFESLPDGRTRLTCASTAVRPKAWLALILKLGDPAGEDLRALKAHLERRTAGTIYETGAQRLDEARHAPAYCGCPKESPVKAWGA